MADPCSGNVSFSSSLFVSYRQLTRSRVQSGGDFAKVFGDYLKASMLQTFKLLYNGLNVSWTECLNAKA